MEAPLEAFLTHATKVEGQFRQHCHIYGYVLKRLCDCRYLRSWLRTNTVKPANKATGEDVFS